MALVKCTECGKEISDKAASCPGCGAPLNGAKAPAGALTQSVRVERAGFKWEAVGFVLILGAMAAGFADAIGIATILGTIGFLVFIVGRIIN